MTVAIKDSEHSIIFAASKTEPDEFVLVGPTQQDPLSLMFLTLKAEKILTSQLADLVAAIPLDVEIYFDDLLVMKGTARNHVIQVKDTLASLKVGS